MTVGNTGRISTTFSATLDYESQDVYTITVTASDGEFTDIQLLSIFISDVNEKPYFTGAHQFGDILESETAARVVLDIAASDQENDVLTYEILSSIPPGAPFTIDSSKGNLHIPFCNEITIGDYNNESANE